MRNIITIAALVSLSGCSLLSTSFPTQSTKVVELTQKGLSTYCAKVPLGERLVIRNTINTPDKGVVAWCTADERLSLFGK